MLPRLAASGRFVPPNLAPLSFSAISVSYRRSRGRVAILKNVFVGRPMRSKGYENRALTVTWEVLTHNLWVMARMTLAAQKQRLAA